MALSFCLDIRADAGDSLSTHHAYGYQGRKNFELELARLKAQNAELLLEVVL
jgi:hypothetical protein